jgi:hypothetical protein
MLELAKSVGSIASSLVPPASSPSTPLRRGIVDPASSPARHDRAFRQIVQIEQLTPQRIVCARIMFRGNTELADEYLSFGNDDVYEIEAWKQWLEEELELVAQLRANRAANHA